VGFCERKAEELRIGETPSEEALGEFFLPLNTGLKSGEVSKKELLLGGNPRRGKKQKTLNSGGGPTASRIKRKGV